MEEPQDLVSKHIRFLPNQITFLETEIHQDISTATRKVINERMNNKRDKIIENHLTTFAIGMIFIFLSLLMHQVIIVATMMMVGVIYICYTTFSLIQWRLSK